MLLLSVLCMALAAAAQPCSTGTLLFKEDFGGNSPDDPRLLPHALSTISPNYQWAQNDAFGSMGSGRYLVTKSGYCNQDTVKCSTCYSQWYLQTDHTYDGDPTRGYFLEVDGNSSPDVLYSCQLNGLCAGTELSFSAWAVNVTAWYNVYVYYPSIHYSYNYPRLKFQFVNPANDVVIEEWNTGDIPADTVWKGPKDSHHSVTWRQYGSTFMLPAGLSDVKLVIRNAALGGSGNDFGLDDIEVRACLPQLMVTSADSVCASEDYTFTADFNGGGKIAEPVEWFLLRSDTNRMDMAGDWQLQPSLTLSSSATNRPGWYRVVAAPSGTTAAALPSALMCCAMSDPFRLHEGSTCMKVEYKTLSGCDSLLVEGKLYYADTLLTDTLSPTLVRKTQVSIGHTTTSVRTLTGQDSVVYKSMVIYKDTVWQDTLVNHTGCDSVLTLQAHVSLIKEEHKTLSGCDSLLVEGKLYYADTLLTDTLSPTLVRKTQVSIGHTTTSVRTLTGQDSVVYKSMVIYKDTVWQDTLVNHTGCDSVLTLQVHVMPVSLFDLIVNKYDWLLLCNNSRLKELMPQLQEVTFQWYRNDTLIVGATHDFYSEEGPLEGTYRLHFVADGQECRTLPVTVHGLRQAKAQIRPNPVGRQAAARLVCGEAVHAEVFTRQGGCVCEADYPAGGGVLPPLETGVYLLRLTCGTGCEMLKLIVQ